MFDNIKCSPIIVGGVGGSGTRLIASILMDAGFFLGTDLNEANDNLWFTLLFRYRAALNLSDEDIIYRYNILKQTLSYGVPLDDAQIQLVKSLVHRVDDMVDRNWLEKRANTLISNDSNIIHTCWGWKEPNTHLFAKQLLAHDEQLKFIHVMRNGLDMSLSKNQNQLRTWGEPLLNTAAPLTPHYSLKYWCHVHRNIIELKKTYPDRVLVVNYDHLCLGNDTELVKLINFTGIDPTTKNHLSSIIVPPTSIGRHKTVDLHQFSTEDIEFVHSLGFDHA